MRAYLSSIVLNVAFSHGGMCHGPQKEGSVLADPIAITGSSILSSMTSADGFIVVPEDVEGFDQGREVEVELYR